MDKIWYRNPSKSEFIGRCGVDENKTNDHAEPTKSRTLKIKVTRLRFKICILILLIDLKRVYTTNNRNESTICHLFSRRRLSHNRRVEKASFF